MHTIKPETINYELMHENRFLREALKRKIENNSFSDYIESLIKEMAFLKEKIYKSEQVEFNKVVRE